MGKGHSQGDCQGALGSESKLWEAIDAPPNNMDAAEYKDAMLVSKAKTIEPRRGRHDL